MTEWHSDLLTKWPRLSDQVTKWARGRVTEWPSDRKLRRQLTVWYIWMYRNYGLQYLCLHVAVLISHTTTQLVNTQPGHYEALPRPPPATNKCCRFCPPREVMWGYGSFARFNILILLLSGLLSGGGENPHKMWSFSSDLLASDIWTNMEDWKWNGSVSTNNLEINVLLFLLL